MLRPTIIVWWVATAILAIISYLHWLDMLRYGILDKALVPLLLLLFSLMAMIFVSRFRTASHLGGQKFEENILRIKVKEAAINSLFTKEWIGAIFLVALVFFFAKMLPGYRVAAALFATYFLLLIAYLFSVRRRGHTCAVLTDRDIILSFRKTAIIPWTEIAQVGLKYGELHITLKEESTVSIDLEMLSEDNVQKLVSVLKMRAVQHTIFTTQAVKELVTQ